MSSDKLHGVVSAVSKLEMEVEAESAARHFFGHECVSVELSEARLDDRDIYPYGGYASEVLSFSADFVARVEHSFDAFDVLSGVRLCDVCGIHSDYLEVV